MTEEYAVRAIHAVRSRNLRVAAYRGNGQWIGIREKMDAEFLFTEDATVRQVGRYLDTVPDEIRLTEFVGDYYCALCGTTAAYTTITESPRRGTWSCADGCARPRPSRLPNRPLFQWLEDIEENLSLR